MLIPLNRLPVGMASNFFYYTYHFSMGVQWHHLVFNVHIAWAISYEHGLLMVLMPNQFKDTIHFDSLY